MKICTGIDIIEIERIKQSIEETNGKFCERVYTKKEIEYCESKKAQKYQHYAARFAAKEAVFKAISGQLESKYEINWKDIEILNDENGRPYVKIRNIGNAEKAVNVGNVGYTGNAGDVGYTRNVGNIDISISHCKKYAIANAIIFFEEK